MRAKTLVRKALIYCIEGERLLVFTQPHARDHEVGLQIPAGTVRADETPRAAAERELREETGMSSLRVERFLGQAFYDITPYRDEIQDRFFFLARATAPLPERWRGHEDHDGQAAPTPFDFFWIPLRSAHALQSGQGAMLWDALDSIEN